MKNEVNDLLWSHFEDEGDWVVAGSDSRENAIEEAQRQVQERIDGPNDFFDFLGRLIND